MTDTLTAFSRYLDKAMGARIRNLSRDELERELLLVHRTTKVAEEVGEAVQRLIGLTGANPRKGVENGPDEFVDELMDVALTVLGAAEHVLGGWVCARPTAPSNRIRGGASGGHREHPTSRFRPLRVRPRFGLGQPLPHL